MAGKKRTPPFEFALEAMERVRPRTNPMFGCLAVYVGDKIVLILRDRPTAPSDNGVWLATTAEHHESLRAEFPRMRSIAVLGADVTGWQNLPADAEDFEESVLRACELILTGDARIGKIPEQKKLKKATAAGKETVRETRKRKARGESSVPSGSNP